jgi:hypothetical protein
VCGAPTRPFVDGYALNTYEDGAAVVERTFLEIRA